MTGRQDLFQQAMNQGHSAAWDQLWEQAAGFYRQALQEFPEAPKALTSLGLALLELNQYNESLECYQRAAKAQPQDPLPVEKAAQICERVGRLEEAVQASLWAADLFMKKNDLDRAIDNWTRAARCAPHNLLAHSRLAVVYDRQGRKSEAVSEYLAMASLLLQAGDRAKATQAVERALQVQPKSSEAHRARLLLKSGEPLPLPARGRAADASQRIARVWQAGSTPNQASPVSSGLEPVSEARQKAMLQLAEILFEQSENEMSMGHSSRRGLTEITRGVGAVSPEQAAQAKLLQHLGQAIDSQTQKQDNQAIQDLEAAMEAGLSHPAASFDLGLLYTQGESPEAAIPHLMQAVKNPTYALAGHLLMGQTMLMVGKLNEAAVQYLEALKIADSQVVSPEHADSVRQLYDPLIEAESKVSDPQRLNSICENVTSLVQRSDWKVALAEARLQLPEVSREGTVIPLAELLLQTSSSQLVTSLATISNLAAEGMYRSAVEEAYFALEFAPTYLPVHVQIGELLLAQGRDTEALEKFLVISRAYSARGEMASAAMILQRIIQLSPQDLEARSRLVSLLAESGQIDEAIRAYIDLAGLHYSLAELDKARSIYMTALRLSQQSAKARTWGIQILNRIGDIDMQRLDWRQAYRIFEQVHNLQPSDQKSRVVLIDLNFRMGLDTPALTDLDNLIGQMVQGGQCTQAIEYVAGLVQEHPYKVEVRKYLIELYRQENRMADAITELDELSNILLKTGDKTGAIETIQAILDLHPAEETGYRRLLEQIRLS